MSSQLAAPGILSNELETASHGLVATKTPSVDESAGIGGVTDKRVVKESKESMILFIASSFREQNVSMLMHRLFDEGGDHFLPLHLAILHIPPHARGNGGTIRIPSRTIRLTLLLCARRGVAARNIAKCTVGLLLCP